MKKKQLFTLAAVLIVLGLALFVIPTPGEPALECVSQSAPSSGFVDDDQDGCPVSTESYNKYRDWESKPKLDNIAGVILLLGGVGAAVVAVLRKPKKTT